jgi:cytochrome c peroxidase
MVGRPRFLALAALAAVVLAAAQEPAPIPADTLPPELPGSAPYGLPDGFAPPGDERSAALGRRLFFDPLLSQDRTVACASCHVPDHGFADAAPRSLGVRGQRTERNAPTLLNRGLGAHFSWDGRAASLDEQVLLPIENPLEMDLALDLALERLAADPGYAAEFAEVFGAAPARDGLARALSAFVSRLFIGDSAVDRFRGGSFAALTPQARSGLWFYESRGACWRCHSGANFTDEQFHNTGVGAIDGEPEPGRAAITGRPEDRGRFKTPTLRGLAFTAPYMHDGSLATLEDVVAFYRTGGHANAHLDERIQPLVMDDVDAANLVAFLKALSQ